VAPTFWGTTLVKEWCQDGIIDHPVGHRPAVAICHLVGDATFAQRLHLTSDWSRRPIASLVPRSSHRAQLTAGV
jgi:hypothetical protein